MNGWRGAWLVAALGMFSSAAVAVTVQFNSTGGSSATNGLHFYIEDTTKIQVRRLNNTGQVYSPGATPPSSSLDNGIFIRANGRVYGPSHNVTSFSPPGGMYNTFSIGTVTPANPSSPGVQQTVNANFGITSGPQVAIVWKYTTPLDFMTAEVTLTIPSTYPVTAANPVRYYHAVDTYLGGSDNGCGVSFVDSNGHRVIGTYPPASGTLCPSSTAIPTGVSVVESFRERSGRNFSRYCAAGWSTFFVNGSPNCSVLQAAQMSNTVTTSWQDTGVGIEYDFTAPGTYVFSYDFVVGSPLVPPYDHLEIQHDGSATLCPENVTVLACTVPTVPCPAANLINTGTLTGNLTVSPATPAVTITPGTFTLGSTASTATVALQGSGAGSYTLGIANPSSVPLNGVRCYNTATSTQSCAFAISNLSCAANFECIETGVAYTNQTGTGVARNPLYTKLVGTDFRFDVVALRADGTPATTYTAAANITVELFDDSASPRPACSAYSGPIAARSVTFASADNGRKTLPTAMNVATAYRKVRCRVTDTNMTPAVSGCSSDDFAIRPQSFAVSSNMTADSAGASTGATPTARTGAAFELTAAAVAGYDGTPLIDSTRIQAHSGAAVAGSISGSFDAANGTTGVSTVSTFGYSEVGYFRFQPGGVYDATFTAVDQVGDCTNDFSNALVSGEYGCKLGNGAATDFFGRFIPDHFDTALTHGCVAGSFTYSAQPFRLDVTARNSGGVTTQNYDGGAGFAKAVALSEANAVTGGSLAPASIAASAFTTGVASLTTTLPSPPTFTFIRGASPEYAPATIKPRVVDAETVSSEFGTEATTLVRIGRLRLSNVYGYKSPLTMPVAAQYWTGKSWLTNTDDNCTVLNTSSLSLTPAGWAAVAPGALVNGAGSIVLNPTSTITVAVCADLAGDHGVTCAATAAALPWLQSRWPGATTYDNDPSAIATFGVFSPEGKRGVYSREMY